MSDTRLRELLASQLSDLKSKGLYKRERQLQGPQGSAIQVGGREVINFCANNYLGLANHPDVVAAAQEALRRYGYGLASVRFICGTQDLHKQLEAALAGSDVCTMSFEVLEQLYNHPLTDQGIDIFLRDWAKVPKA